jgi:TM2 domain-containing membrane protein YozV
LPSAEKKIQAALLAILQGGLGIRKFLLGSQREGLIMAAGTVGSFIIATVIGPHNCGVRFILLLIPFAVSITGLIEGGDLLIQKR